MKQSLAAKAMSSAFEVKMYNRNAREQARLGATNDRGAHRCADLTSRVIHARDEVEARQLAQRSWPPEEGFVISSVSQVTLQ